MQEATQPRCIYLVQGDGTQKPYRFPEGSDSLSLQWQREYIPKPRSFHFPNSTWASGRNELFRRAKELGTYDYFVFLDDDVTFGGIPWKMMMKYMYHFVIRLIKNIPRGSLPSFESFAFPMRHMLLHGRTRWSLENFEEAVARTKPLIAYPNLANVHPWYDKASSHAVDGTTFGDQLFVCIHASVANRLLPYSTGYDTKNWWLCGEQFCRLASDVCRHGKIHRYNHLFIMNGASRPYPRGRNRCHPPENTIEKADLS